MPPLSYADPHVNVYVFDKVLVCSSADRVLSQQHPDAFLSGIRLSEGAIHYKLARSGESRNVEKTITSPAIFAVIVVGLGVK